MPRMASAQPPALARTKDMMGKIMCQATFLINSKLNPGVMPAEYVPTIGNHLSENANIYEMTIPNTNGCTPFMMISGVAIPFNQRGVFGHALKAPIKFPIRKESTAEMISSVSEKGRAA